MATFDGSALKKHKGLRKHESSVLTQIRTGMIGLRAFLHWRRVPDVVTPLCRCAGEPETVDHVILRCPEHENARGRLRQSLIEKGQPLYTRRDLADASANIGIAWAVV